jgi:hypothetical protein
LPSDSASSSPPRQPDGARDLQGVSRLVVDAIVGVTDIVESMHHTISGLAPIVGPPREGRTTGLTGWVYRSVRGVSRAVGAPLDAALGRLAPLLANAASSRQREAVVAALNGVLGDYLAASNNPLARPMRLHTDGQPVSLERPALEDAVPAPGPKLLVLVHGLCMSDRNWCRDGHDHGAALARDLGYTPLYLRYNSGLHISTNGRRFADQLEQLVRAWPVPVREVTILGHSMGGLVARSACHYAEAAGHDWPRRLTNLVFLGTPHHGAPLERAGNWVDLLAGISPYTAPFARIGTIRSNGVKDLRYGTLVEADWQRAGSTHAHDPRTPVPLPDHTHCFAGAATRKEAPFPDALRLPGDGLVPVSSALGHNEDPAHALSLPHSHQRVHDGLNHFDLLSSRAVYDQLHRWLDPSGR